MYLGGSCYYDHLEKSTKNPGNALGRTYRSKSFLDCQAECDDNKRCNNFKICRGDCTLYDGLISKNSELDQSTDPSLKCMTFYKTCPPGTFINLVRFFQLDLIYFDGNQQGHSDPRILNLQISVPCASSVFLSGVERSDGVNTDAFGLYNLIGYDENHNGIYRHNNYKKFTLKQGIAQVMFEGWWVSYLTKYMLDF